MANREHLAKLKEGPAAWTEWRKAHPKISPDLSGADLSNAKLAKTNLRSAHLSKANLSHARLRWADLRGAQLADANIGAADLRSVNLRLAELSNAILRNADLSDADLGGASLNDVDLSGANVSGTNLSNSDLWGADLSWADLRGANFGNAFIGGTTFGNNDLSRAKGLDTVRHHGASTIGIDTIYRSHGKIPLAFLRGAGVPDNFIEYMGSLTGKALEFYSCFISYSTKNEDQEFADRLYADLQNKGVRCWFAPHDIQAGKKIHEQIDEAIRRFERLLLILSPNSMKSEWVKTEIRKARKRERTEKKRVLFPVRLASFEAIRDWELFDADEGKDLAVEIREYFIPDFSDWKNHDSYAEGLKNLLRDLKAEGSEAA